MGLKDNILPPGNPLNPDGSYRIEHENFLKRLEMKNLSDPLADLAPTATLADVITRLNAIKNLLEDQGLIDK